MAQAWLVSASLSHGDGLPQLYAGWFGVHCYAEHGGVPLDAADAPASKNVTNTQCEALCNDNALCQGFSQSVSPYDSYSIHGDCYLRSALDIKSCDVATDPKPKWATFVKVDPAPLSGNVVYHLFEAKYTGLGNKDGGDYRGDMSFIFSTFTNFTKGNPEASMDHNVVEMSAVNVTGWAQYEACNAPGAEGLFTCPADQPDYCCTVRDPITGKNVPVDHTRDSLPGLSVSRGPTIGLEFSGYWMSFPQASRGNTWTETVLRRVAGKCLGDAWRAASGGCEECGEVLDSCVSDCIQATLSWDQLQATWDRIFASPEECPDVPLPSQCDLVEHGSGQRQTPVPSCVGSGCNATGRARDCAWCVYDMDACMRVYGNACNDTATARAAQGVSCDAPKAVEMIV